MLYFYKMAYHSAIRKGKLESFVGQLTHLETISLSEINHCPVLVGHCVLPLPTLYSL